jgi:phosphate uptake regulator
VHLVAEAVGLLGSDTEAATEKANEALRAQRQIERVYRDAMASLVGVEDLREVMSRRELYRRVPRIGEVVVDVAERVWYTVVKEA